MTGERRLAAFYGALRSVGLQCLVMGGHAVRFYGVDRSTVDYDFYVAAETRGWDVIHERFAGSDLLRGAVEGSSWRPRQFKRFIVGRLPDGREERLECWRTNHLLAPFDELWRRREEGPYGGSRPAFLALEDLIRSKETERDDDWRDVRLLEEIADERLLEQAKSAVPVDALAKIRSRRGFESALAAGLFGDSNQVTAAAQRSAHPVSLAYLAPFAPEVIRTSAMNVAPRIATLLQSHLSRVAPGSARPLALVEAVRRLHQKDAMAKDREAKERARLEPP